jgi:hypothetical protein
MIKMIPFIVLMLFKYFKYYIYLWILDNPCSIQAAIGFDLIHAMQLVGVYL